MRKQKIVTTAEISFSPGWVGLRQSALCAQTGTFYLPVAVADHRDVFAGYCGSAARIAVRLSAI
jgi:hypothetical protein